MKQKLLSKTLQIYVIYATITVAVCSVFFYTYLDQLFQEEAIEHLQQSKAEISESIRLVDSKEALNAWNEAHENAKIKRISKAVPSKIYQKKVYSSQEEEWIPFLFLEETIATKKQSYLLQLRANLIEKDDLVESISTVFALLLFLLVGGMIVVTKISSKRLWKPFYSSLNKIQSFELKQAEPISFDSSNVKEFNELNRCLDLLVSNNQLIYQEQKKFTENAAHELQTPLAIINGQINLLSQSIDLSESQAHILEKMNHAINRMTRLNKNLLVLSKLESVQFQVDEINFSQKLEHYCVVMKEIASSKGIVFLSEIQPNRMVQSHVLAVESIIENLLSNAINHNYEGGSVHVKLDETSLVIKNTGKNNALETAMLFKRFERGTTDSTGNGLGLAIVKSCALQNNWRLDYDFVETKHQFSLFFNAKTVAKYPAFYSFIF